jgi:HrpA-like RNA helicase
VRPGHAFRLCTEKDYNELLPDASVPEMQRSDLASLLLQLKVSDACHTAADQQQLKFYFDLLL